MNLNTTNFRQVINTHRDILFQTRNFLLKAGLKYYIGNHLS